MKDEPNERSMSSSIRLFWKLLAEDVLNEKKLLITGFVFALISGFFVALIPHSIQLIIDRAIPLKSMPLLGRYSILLLGAMMAGACLWYVQVSLIARASENIFHNFKLRLSDAILRKHMSFFSRYQSSDLLTRMVFDLELVSEFFYKSLLKSLVLSVFTLVFFIYILILNLKLAMIAFLGIPVLGIIMAALDKPITRTSATARKRLSDQNERVLDILQGYKEIRFFQQHKKMLAHAASTFSDCAEANFKFLRTMGITEFLLESAGVLILFLPVVIGGYAICSGATGITLGLIVGFQTYLIILSDGVNKISLGFAEAIKATPAIGRLLEILDYPDEEKPRQAGLDDIPDSMEIEFKRISFGYLKDRNILTQFNLHVSPAEKVCIMGPSGSGKSTIANLLLRFLYPDAGEIALGKIDIRKYPLASYLSHFSYVWQDTYLFKLSVRENVRLGWFNVPDEMIEKVIEQVGLKQSVESLPEQYETIIGRNGVNLSGGQRQRLALARALIRGPEILILDEFTSALDSEIEQKMLDDIFTLFARQTIICITHSAQVAKRFDRIVRLDAPVPGSMPGLPLDKRKSLTTR